MRKPPVGVPERRATTAQVRRAARIVLPNQKFLGHLVVGANGYSLAPAE